MIDYILSVMTICSNYNIINTDIISSQGIISHWKLGAAFRKIKQHKYIHTYYLNHHLIQNLT